MLQADFPKAKKNARELLEKYEVTEPLVNVFQIAQRKKINALYLLTK